MLNPSSLLNPNTQPNQPITTPSRNPATSAHIIPITKAPTSSNPGANIPTLSTQTLQQSMEDNGKLNPEALIFVKGEKPSEAKDSKNKTKERAINLEEVEDDDDK